MPDIEEINSSLRPDPRIVEAEARARAGERTPAAARRRTGFRIGFVAVGVVTAVLVALYVFAMPLGEAVPELSDPLARYVTWIDTQRVALIAATEALTMRLMPAA